MFGKPDTNHTMWGKTRHKSYDMWKTKKNSHNMAKNPQNSFDMINNSKKNSVMAMYELYEL